MKRFFHDKIKKNINKPFFQNKYNNCFIFFFNTNKREYLLCRSPKFSLVVRQLAYYHTIYREKQRNIGRVISHLNTAPSAPGPNFKTLQPNESAILLLKIYTSHSERVWIGHFTWVYNKTSKWLFTVCTRRLFSLPAPTERGMMLCYRDKYPFPIYKLIMAKC